MLRKVSVRGISRFLSEKTWLDVLVLGGIVVTGVVWVSLEAQEKSSFNNNQLQKWVKYEGNPVLVPVCSGWPKCDPDKEAEWDSWDTEGVCVVKVGSTYHMFYEGDQRQRDENGEITVNIADQIGHATSIDGIHWEKSPENPILQVNSKEDTILSPAVIYHDGRFWMYYNVGFNSIRLAISKDSKHWERKGIVLTPTPGSWDQHGVRDVWILHNGKQFLMWYTGDIEPLEKKEHSAIGFAWSEDGIEWTKHPAPVLEPLVDGFDNMAVYDPTVIYDNGEFKMWYIGVNEELFAGEKSLGWHICYASSKEGKNWERYPDNPVLRPGDFPFEKNEVGSPCVIQEGNVYKMWYVGGVFHDLSREDAGAQAAGIGYATWDITKVVKTEKFIGIVIFAIAGLQAQEKKTGSRSTIQVE